MLQNHPNANRLRLSTQSVQAPPEQKQSGFTLMELLIALSLTLVIVVAVQRYVAGVVSDQEHLGAQQDQTSQTFIVLNNIQRDVTRSGFTPVAAQLDDNPVTPVSIQKCTTSQCEGDELIVQYWQYAVGDVYDCVGHKVDVKDNWALVRNTYRIRSSGELGCHGNGGESTATFDLLNSVHSHSWRISKDAQGKQLLHICVTVGLGRNEQVAGNHKPKDCHNDTPLDSKRFCTTEVDVLIRPQEESLILRKGGAK